MVKSSLVVLAAVLVSSVTMIATSRASHDGASVAAVHVPAADSPVDVGAQLDETGSDVIVVPDVMIVVAARHVPSTRVARQTAACGAFALRPVLQGPASGAVRGFCL